MSNAALFRKGCALCGLTSNQLVADHFGVSLDQASSWLTGRRPIKDGVWVELATLYDQVIELSEHALDAFDAGEISLDGIQALATREHGSLLPAPAAETVMAAWYLTRLMDQSDG